MLRARALLAALLLLSGCRDLVSACYSCLDSSPHFPVAEEEVAEIKLIPSQRPLPRSASNVFYAEECGIDCSQTIMFDAPLADARAFAKAELGKDLTRNLHPWIDEDKRCGSVERPAIGWWMNTNVIKGEGGIACGNLEWQLRLLIEPKGKEAAVWGHAFTM